MMEFKLSFRTPATVKNENAQTNRAFHFFVAEERIVANSYANLKHLSAILFNI